MTLQNYEIIFKYQAHLSKKMIFINVFYMSNRVYNNCNKYTYIGHY
jgi:hypothetical protein